MLRNSEIKASSALYLILVLVCSFALSNATPVSVQKMDYDTTSVTTEDVSSTSVDNDLYVIKAVVYEIGILTDADNSTSDSTERQEEVKIALYDQSTNGNVSLKHDTPVPDTILSK